MAKKILIIGTSGSGKTTFGKQLATASGLPFRDLDDLYWLPDWHVRSRAQFQELLDAHLASDAWIIAGNYGEHRRAIWAQAEVIVWLDLPFWTLIKRVLWRTIERSLKKELCCNGNRETIGRLFSRHSMVLWVFRTYWRRKRNYERLFAEVGAHKTCLRLCSEGEVAAWLENYPTKDLQKAN